MYIISGCLLGHNCKYNGGSNRCEAVLEFCRTHKYVTVCPESAAQLPKPRPPAERLGDRILDREGKDLTDAFRKGAEVSWQICTKAAELAGEPLEGAILKANSPSCGFGKIYDGTFSGSLTDGNGVFAALLDRHRIEVMTEKEKIEW